MPQAQQAFVQALFDAEVHLRANAYIWSYLLLRSTDYAGCVNK